MKKPIVKAHRIAAIISLVVLILFWLSTALSELSGLTRWVVTVKTVIPWGLFILVPALIITGASGFRMMGNSTYPAIVTKKRRMPFIAFNGVIVLIPSALILATLARGEEFGLLFWTVQTIELLAGAINITLITCNIRAGIALRRKRLAA